MASFTDILKAAHHAALLDKHAEEGCLLEMPMPNGKLLSECTGTEFSQMAEWAFALEAELKGASRST